MGRGGLGVDRNRKAVMGGILIWQPRGGEGEGEVRGGEGGKGEEGESCSISQQDGQTDIWGKMGRNCWVRARINKYFHPEIDRQRNLYETIVRKSKKEPRH